MGLAHEGMAQHGTAVFAHEQTRGKGQRNKEWISQKGQNIAISLILEPQGLALSELFLLSMAVANGVYDCLNKYIGGELSVKWPNDMYWRDRKAGGILIENVLQGSAWRFAIAGIGLNINQVAFHGLQSKAISLKQITGKEYEPLALAKELCLEINESFNVLHTRPSEIIELYNSHLYKINKTVRLKKDNRVFEAVIKEVTRDGRLVVQHSIEESFSVGEVEWQI
jgi:BirA family biotin operon repressor/biotin-[acetyl-CoA-carboxylase] ligase